MDQPLLTPGQRMADGLAGLTRGISSDVYFALMNTWQGNGQAVPPPYITNQTSAAQEQGLTDLVDGALDALLGRESDLDRDWSPSR